MEEFFIKLAGNMRDEVVVLSLVSFYAGWISNKYYRLFINRKKNDARARDQFRE